MNSSLKPSMPFDEMNMSSLRNWYNKAAEATGVCQQVKRFSDIPTAQKRCEKLYAEISELNNAPVIEPVTVTAEDQPSPATPSNGTKFVGRRSKLNGKRLISTREVNPRREGSHGWHSHNIILVHPGITYEDYRSAGGRNNDLRWDVEREWVLIE